MKSLERGPLAFGAWREPLARFAANLATSEATRILDELCLSEAATDRELQQCQGDLGGPLPCELEALFRGAGRLIRFRYRWEGPDASRQLARCGLADSDALWGGPAFDLAALPSLWREMRQQAERCFVSGAEAETEREFWLSSVPLMRMDNGDYLALERGEGALAEVRYLSHEAPGEVLADSLLEFLEAWEGLGYVGPEIWMLEPFRRPETGRLDAGTLKAGASHAPRLMADIPPGWAAGSPGYPVPRGPRALRGKLRRGFENALTANRRRRKNADNQSLTTSFRKRMGLSAGTGMEPPPMGHHILHHDENKRAGESTVGRCDSRRNGGWDRAGDCRGTAAGRRPAGRASGMAVRAAAGLSLRTLTHAGWHAVHRTALRLPLR